MAMADLRGIYVRTTAGLEELRTRASGLTAQQRSLLILLDGKSALASLAAPIGCGAAQLPDLAEALLGHGLIAAVSPAADAGSESASAALIALAEQVFAARAAPVSRQIEKAGTSPAELRAAVERAAKLARLTIDEGQAARFLAMARERLGG